MCVLYAAVWPKVALPVAALPKCALAFAARPHIAVGWCVEHTMSTGKANMFAEH